MDHMPCEVTSETDVLWH